MKMQYRRLVCNEPDVSILGLGTMRLPVRNATNDIDRQSARAIVLKAIDQGINYIDTGFTYHGGQCEEFLGWAVPHSCRKHVDIVTKMPLWLVNDKKDLDRIFQSQLRNLRFDQMKYYMIHALNRDALEKMRQFEVLSWIEKKRRDGAIQHIGFSFHDSYDVFADILDEYDGWEYCQIQYNYLQEDYQAGTRGITLAASKGLGIIVMEPLLGGILANPPENVRNAIVSYGIKRSPVELALHWLWDKKEIALVLSGMNTEKQLLSNCMSASTACCFSKEDHGIIKRISGLYKGLKPILCTACRYCMPCPNGLDIVRNIEIFNLSRITAKNNCARELYNEINISMRAEKCTKCGNCVSVCPQKIDIMYWMGKIYEEFGNKV